MYVLTGTYKKSAEEVSQQTEAHVEWVKKYFKDGTFIAAGPKKDKNGGVILAKGIDRKALDAILSEDSFVKSDVADYTIVEFDCKLAKEGLEELQTA